MKKLFVLMLLLFYIESAYCDQLTSTNLVTTSKQADAKKEITKWQLLSGFWYGSQMTVDGKLKKWVMHRSLDGKYVVTFKIYKDKNLIDSDVEYGEWGFSGDVLFGTLKGWIQNGKAVPADPVDPYCYDAYQIQKLNSNQFEYKHVATGNSYSVVKVSADFKF